MLGYIKFNARRNWKVNGVIKSFGLSEMREAYEKPQCKTKSALQVASKWRMAHFHVICREDFASDPSNALKQVGVDRRFKSHVVWKHFNKVLEIWRF